jgi:hypothetical protein
MKYINQKFNNNTIYNQSNFNNYINTNKITFYISENEQFIDFYFPGIIMENKNESVYDILNIDGSTVIKVKNEELKADSNIIRSSKKLIIQFFNTYEDTLNKQFNLLYSCNGHIETYSGTGNDFLQELVKTTNKKKYNITDTPNDCCSICLNDEGRWVELYLCKHKFHEDCINRIEINSVYKCPICRTYN